MSEDAKLLIIGSIAGANFGVTWLMYSLVMDIRGRLIVIAERLYPPFPVADE